MIERINHAIKQGLHGLGDMSESRGFPLDDDGHYATNVEDVKSLVRVVSNQTIEDSVALFGHQE
ncbi:hypothetical protein CASFOL_031088 [Castilleja foliolosa]|uniref:Uncharacterized protein n=1 Tax=Castilleja foliolosa TaxID=1961234 RepID=A0ABD3C3Q7_9LAMI